MPEITFDSYVHFTCDVCLSLLLREKSKVLLKYDFLVTLDLQFIIIIHGK